MEKSVHTGGYRALMGLLVEMRRAAGIRQVDLAKRLKTSQSFVSKVERGELRLDVMQLRTVCTALGTTLGEFVEELEKRLGGGAGRGKRAR